MFIDSSSSKEPIRIMFSPAWDSQEYWAKGESQKKPQREREGREREREGRWRESELKMFAQIMVPIQSGGKGGQWEG